MGASATGAAARGTLSLPSSYEQVCEKAIQHFTAWWVTWKIPQTPAPFPHSLSSSFPEDTYHRRLHAFGTKSNLGLEVNWFKFPTFKLYYSIELPVVFSVVRLDGATQNFNGVSPCTELAVPDHGDAATASFVQNHTSHQMDTLPVL